MLLGGKYFGMLVFYLVGLELLNTSVTGFGLPLWLGW